MDTLLAPIQLYPISVDQGSLSGPGEIDVLFVLW